MKPTIRLRSFLLGTTLLAAAPSLVAQTIFDWKDDAPDANWTTGAAGNRWYDNTLFINLSVNPGFGSLRFNNNHQLTMTNNVAGTYNMHGFIFDVLGTSARTLNGNTVRLFGNDSPSADPFISNLSSATHVINLNLEGDGDTFDPLKVNLNSTGGLTFGGTIDNKGSTIDVQGTGTAGTVSFNGAISGGGGMTKANANTTLVLGASNSYTGGTTLSAGTLQLRHANSLGTGSPGLSMSSGTTLQLRNDVNTTFAAAIATPAAGVTYNFDVNQATASGTGRTLTLGNITFANNTSNQINVTGGNSYILALGTITAPSSPNPFTNTINATTAAVTIANFKTGNVGHTLALQGGNAITLSNYELTSNGAHSLTVSGSGTVVTLGTTTANSNRTGAGNSAYTLNSGNTLNLTSTTSIANFRISGGTASAPTFAINGGTLNNTSGSALTLGGLATATQNNRPTITIGGNFAFGTDSSTSANDLDLGPSAVPLGNNRVITVKGSATLTLGGIVSGTNFSLTKEGSGTLKLGGLNTFSGATTVTSGTLAISSTGKLYNITNGGTRTVTVSSGATLELYAWAYGSAGGLGEVFFGSPLNVNGGTIKYTGVGENTGNNNSRTFTIGTGGATLEAAGSGNWFMTQHSTPVDQTIGNGLTLTLTGSSNGNYSNKLVGSGGAVTKSGAGTWTLAGANTYTGATTVSAGTLAINGNQNAATGAVSVAAGLTNATAVRLKGTGTVGGNTSFAADPDGANAQVGGIHSPGNSVGKQTFDQSGAGVTNLTYNAGSIFEWELASSLAETVITTDLPGAYASNRGTAYDAVNVTGTLGGSNAIFRVVLDGTQTFADTFWNASRTWTDIFRNGDGTSTNNLSYASIFSGGFQYYNYSGVGGTLNALATPTLDGTFSLSGNTLTWTPVPEPTSALAGLLLGAGLLRRRRRA